MGGTSRVQFDLRDCAPMTRAEEHRCATDYLESKDPALGKRLVMANMRLVVAVARRYCRVQADMADVVQEGNRALLIALQRYDPNRGIKFSSYAVWWIRALMLKFTIDNWRLVRVGTTGVQRKLFFQLRKVRNKLELLGGTVDNQQLAAALQVKETEIVAMLERFAGGETSLDAPLRSQEPNSKTVGDSLSGAAAAQPDLQVENAEFIEAVRSKLRIFGRSLHGREASIFRRRLLSEDPVTLARLAIEFGVTRERARQVEYRLKARIRCYLQEELGESFGSLAAAA
jgi:RNA polymerase sigma-32 factor